MGSAGGRGLKPFIDKVHAMGLKVGMHTLQGSITRAALNADSPVLGAGGATVNDIVGPGCNWQRWGFGVDLAAQPAAGQLYLDSVYSQYAAWGLDLIKNDCVFATNWDISGSPLIRGVKRAITKAGHPTVYSISPGQEATLAEGRNISQVANMYRITGDWHDCAGGTWGAVGCGNLTTHFTQAHAFETLIGESSCCAHRATCQLSPPSPVLGLYQVVPLPCHMDSLRAMLPPQASRAFQTSTSSARTTCRQTRMTQASVSN